MAEATLPTYRTSARMLEGETGAGIRLIAWTAARTILIAPPFLVLGVEPTTAWTGAALASALMSTFAVLRIFNAGQAGLNGTRKRRALSGARPKRRVRR